MKLIVGLGNPGKEYEKTRHNLGFRVLDSLAGNLKAEFDRTKFKGEYATAELPDEWVKNEEDDRKLLLVKPQTYMNLSGETVQNFAGFYKIELGEVLAVVDDVALPVGALRLRRGGSDGGHNGLKDITRCLGSQDYARLRIGVGGRDAQSQQQPRDLAGHVLSRFSAEEEEQLKGAFKLAVEASLCWAGRGVEAAMNKYNTNDAPKQKKSEPKEKTDGRSQRPDDGKQTPEKESRG